MIDWARVAELREEIGAEDFGEIVDLFLTEVDGAIDLLAENAGNREIVAEQMHFLKGASLNLGFSALAGLCRDGEKAAMSGNPDLVTADALRETFAAARGVFERDFPQRFAA
ncbi:Hpt domain-containing protein [Thetidibacter halocola]|uniref:Hpt domain-containing protein n=1 Tax=Thetidibacter halocola TaxID=2827239 RepID=A0A8J8B675_9RHOB|nr:Hpt domain-containing protein [Thetidibacter halocola]MBS0123721.1 Hpt domain-containing protein [Thetidibacter halocola]